jgi:hypothetical protein
MWAIYRGRRVAGAGIFRGFSPRAAAVDWEILIPKDAPRQDGTVNAGQRSLARNADRSCTVKDLFFPLAVFLALHAVFIGTALTVYVH